MIVQRTEKHVIKKDHHYHSMFCEFTRQSKNLYNHANYLVRKEFIENNKWLRYQDLDKLLKKDITYPDYKNMPTAQCAQQTLQLLDRSRKSFFNSVKDWSVRKDKYSGKPKLPKYKRKDGQFMLVLTGQQVKQKNNLLKFPKSFHNFTITSHCTSLSNFEKINQVRIIPHNRIFCVEIVYSISIRDTLLQDNGRHMSIDLGLDNLATIVTNTGLQPILVNCKGLKSINQYYNKTRAYYQSIAKQMNDKFYTNRLYRLTQKRNFKIEDALHKISKFIVDTALEHKITMIVIGNNKDWKQSISLGKRTNQSFVQISHQNLIEKIVYKSRTHGISVVLTEESYTSGTSFLDSELPTKENYNKKRRKYRGLFMSNSGVLINADVHAAYQIMKKVFPNEFSDGIEGVVSHPVKVTVA